ncbi:magnesium transporter [Sporosarcina pasteurii]|uniref:magnesium transporter n=1 Tax=Sporosarcina pasteurii TaxID=1474 RepID=UPI002113E363|nr:magnesium transporter [Sporosarcina pasteurii]MDS9471888.1 magnesium transporter [Sporosarcina pasteurii]
MDTLNKKDDKEGLTRGTIQLLKDGKKDIFRELIEELKPYDQAMLYQNIPTKHKPLFLELLTLLEVTGLLRHLSKDEQLLVLKTLDPKRATDILDLMEVDDLAFLLDDLSLKEIDNLIVKMQLEEMEILRRIMRYPKKTAGRVMTTRYIWVHHSYTVEQAIHKLKSFRNIAAYINYLYVIDDDKKLIGVVSYRDLLLADLNKCIEMFMEKNVVKIDGLTKQEEAAKIIGRYDFVSLPVTDENNILVGIITVDDILDIVVQEANEDIEKLLATGKEITFQTNPFVAARRRMPWLILLLFIGLVSGGIIERFENTLETVVALAFFMPMIAGMTGNTGTQSLAVVVRGLVSEDLNFKKASQLLFRELLVGIIIGITCAIFIAMIAYVWRGSLALGLVVGASLLATLIIGTLAGTVIPLILYKLKADPAVASGPLITTINDILSLLIYFGIATMFISNLM